MGKYNIGDVWWIHFPYRDEDKEKRRPAIVIDDDTIAVLAMYVTSKKKDSTYSIEIEDWEAAGLTRPSWTRIDRIIRISEWYMDRKIGNLSSGDMTKIMQLVAEIMENKFHEFLLLVVRNTSGKCLQKYDERWKCWLFPYIRSTEANKANVDKYVNKLFKVSLPTHYITNTKQCKYSESDKVYKIYDHKLYEVLLKNVPDHMRTDEFSIGDVKYKWFTLAELEQDENVMKKNADIVALVREKCFK